MYTHTYAHAYIYIYMNEGMQRGRTNVSSSRTARLCRVFLMARPSCVRLSSPRDLNAEEKTKETKRGGSVRERKTGFLIANYISSVTQVRAILVPFTDVSYLFFCFFSFFFVFFSTLPFRFHVFLFL